MSLWTKLKVLLGVAEVAADIAVKNPEKRKIMEKVTGVVDPIVEAKVAQEQRKEDTK